MSLTMPNGASGSGRVALLCSVAGCRRPLTRNRRVLSCPRAHSFDVAHSGYVNLLQPRDRRSIRPGDAPATVAARRRLAARGFETPITHAIARLLTLDPGDAVLDVGCGDGHHLAAVAAGFGAEGHGLDISVAAIEAAAQRYPELSWVVANADRFLPYADGSFRAVTSITAQRNPAEFRRVLGSRGVLLLVVPAPDDLIEVRERILGERIERDRVERAVATFAPLFTLDRHERVRHAVRLDAASVRDVMAVSYRAGRASRLVRLAEIGDLDVTLSRDALVFRPAAPSARRARRG